MATSVCFCKWIIESLLNWFVQQHWFIYDQNKELRVLLKWNDAFLLYIKAASSWGSLRFASFIWPVLKDASGVSFPANFSPCYARQKMIFEVKALFSFILL